MGDPISAGIMAGSTGLSVLGSILGANKQARAAKDAAQAQERSQNRALDLYESIYRDQTQRNEPFRQLELQQANAFGELFGFDPVAQPATSGASSALNAFDDLGANNYGRFVLSDPELYSAFNSLSGKAEKKIGRAGFDLNHDGNLSLEEYGAYIADQRGGIPDSVFNPTASTAGLGRDLTMPETTGQAVATLDNTPNDQGRSRFENSIFYDLGQIGLNEGGGTGDPYERFMASPFAQVARSGASRDLDRIDSALGAQGALFSSTRQAHADDAFADRMTGAFADFINNDRFAAQQQGNAFNNYLSAMMGSPPQQATQNQQFLSASLANNAGNAFNQIGNAQAAGSIGQANAFNAGFQGVSDAIGGGLGMFGGDGGNLNFRFDPGAVSGAFGRFFGRA